MFKKYYGRYKDLVLMILNILPESNCIFKKKKHAHKAIRSAFRFVTAFILILDNFSKTQTNPPMLIPD